MVDQKKILEKIVAISEEFLQPTGSELNCQKITDTILDISGAKYAVFNLYDEDGSKFRTVALSAPDGIIKKVSSLLGFKLLGKEWEHNPVCAEKIKSHAITHFSTLSELTEGLIPKPLVSLVEKTFNIGEVVLVKILKENVIFGDFTLIMPGNVEFKNDNYVEIYTRQVGLLITRKKAIEGLRESEEIFKSFMEHSPIYVFFKDENIRALRLSKNYETMLGKPVEELLGKDMYDLFPSKLAKAMVEDDMMILKAGQTVNVEEELNGRVYSTIKFPIFIEGKPRYLAGYTTDITERKKTEEKLRESEKTLREAQKIANIGSWTLDVLTQKAKWSRQVYSIFGLDPKNGELSYPQGHKEKLIYPDDWEKFEKTLNNSVSQGIDYNITVRFINQTNGKIGFMNTGCRTQKDMNGKVVKLIGTCQDITEMIRTQDLLEMNKRRLSYILKESGIGEWEWDVKNNNVYYSKSVKKIIGYRDNEMANDLNEFIKRLHPDDKDRMLKNLDALNKIKSKKFTAEYRLLCKNGQYKWINLVGNVASRDKDGNPLRLEGIVIDISERKKREQEVINLARFPSENPNPVMRIDYKGRILYFNQACKSLPGWEQKIGDIVVQDFLKKILAVVKSQTEETSILQFGGKTYIFNIANIAEFNYINLYGRDISDRIAIEKILQELIIEKDVIASAERIRMEKEIHDTLSQTIFSTNLLADSIPSLWKKDRQEALKQLEKIKLLTKESEHQFRRILLELKTNAFLFEDLGDLIRQLAYSLQFRSEISVELSIKGKHNHSKEVTEAFYRICQEALNNIIKYSCASMVKIELESLPEKTCLRIKDNGVGFDKKKVSQKSLGLYIMRKRAKDINAALNIDSKIGRGTKIAVKL